MDIIGRIANEMVHRDRRRGIQTLGLHQQIGKGHPVMTIRGMEGQADNERMTPWACSGPGSTELFGEWLPGISPAEGMGQPIIGGYELLGFPG